MEYINCTPHEIRLNDGEAYPSSGSVARVAADYHDAGEGNFREVYGKVVGLPEPQAGVKYIVSGIVFRNSTRRDIVAPATGHPLVARNEQGHIQSVPGFILK